MMRDFRSNSRDLSSAFRLPSRCLQFRAKLLAIAFSRRAQRFSAADLRAVSRAIDIAAIAISAKQNLRSATRAVEDSIRIVQRETAAELDKLPWTLAH